MEPSPQAVPKKPLGNTLCIQHKVPLPSNAAFRMGSGHFSQERVPAGSGARRTHDLRQDEGVGDGFEDGGSGGQGGLRGGCRGTHRGHLSSADTAPPGSAGARPPRAAPVRDLKDTPAARKHRNRPGLTPRRWPGPARPAPGTAGGCGGFVHPAASRDATGRWESGTPASPRTNASCREKQKSSLHLAGMEMFPANSCPWHVSKPEYFCFHCCCLLPFLFRFLLRGHVRPLHALQVHPTLRK